MVDYPWHALLKWQPFRIDALGIVTLLGSEEINASVGRLVRSTYLEFLPLLGAFVIAGDRFREKEAGYKFYNITDGIHTPDLAAWLTRWIKAQEFEKQRSIVRWSIVPAVENSTSRRTSLLCSLGIGFSFNAMLFVLTVLSKDGWGIANAVSMLVSIFVRWYLVRENTMAIDHRVRNPALDADVRDAKVLIVTPDSKAVTMTMPRWLIRHVFCTNPVLLRPQRYYFVRWLGW